MKILQLISSAGYYGAEAMVLTLSQALNNSGHNSTIGIFYNSHLPNTEIVTEAKLRNLSIEIIPCNGKLDLDTIARLRKLTRHTGFDIVHTHGYKADIYGFASMIGSKNKIISTCHNWIENDAPLRLYATIDRFVLRHFDMAVAVSEGVASTLQEEGVCRRKIRIVSNGIDTERFARSSILSESELSKAHQLVIGIVARLSPEKGIDFFVGAAAAMLRKNLTVTFQIVGEGPERARLEQLAEDLGVRSSVSFLGKRSDMPAVYAGMDIVVLASLTEGLPMTLLEAMASGKAVVATAVGAVPTVVVHESTGLLVQPGDAVAIEEAVTRLWRDGELRRRVADAGAKTVRARFSAQAMAANYLDLYHEVTAKASKGSAT